MSTKVRYTVASPVTIRAGESVTYIRDASDATQIVEDVYSSIDIDLEITISGVTMHAHGWLNPDHWAEDWFKLAGDRIEGDEVADIHDFIAGLIRQAVVD